MANTKEVNETPKETERTETVKKTIKKENKPRKPREIVRPTKECMAIDPKKLTEKEKINLIEALKAELNVTNMKNACLDDNVIATREQLRSLETQYDAMEQFYRVQLQYIDNQMTAFHQAVNQATKAKGVN